MASQARIFISYKRDTNPDDPIAKEVHDALMKLGHYVFIDKDMPAGINWGKRVEEELRKANFFIPFLSKNSINSEMVRGEIERAYHLAKRKCEEPKILPVRLNYREPFQYPINVYLSSVNWVLWEKPDDTQRLINNLINAVAGIPLPIDQKMQSEIIEIIDDTDIPPPSYSAQLTNLEMPEGTLDPGSKFYIERDTDQVAMNAISRQGVTITIKAPRQMGKSSLLMRIIRTARQIGKQVVFLDFQLFDKPALEDANTFFHQFCAWLTTELDVEDHLADYWNVALSNSQRSTRYVERYLLKQVNAPLVLAMDEVETAFDTNFRSDFFGMLRSWHNKRIAGSIWKNLDLALVTSTEPYQLIENLNQSPFNVGEVIELSDFSLEQVSDLNKLHGFPFNANQEKILMKLLNGHPYLTRRALYLVASERLTVQELFKHAIEDQGPFGDHLRYHLFRIHNKEDLIYGLKQIIDHNTCSDDRIFFRLRGAGLIKRENGKVIPRCELYQKYFRERLHV